MQLSDVIKKIQVEKKLNQSELAERLGTVQQNIANMRLGRPIWQQHWELFLKLLPLCAELDLIGEQELLGRPKHEQHPDSSASAQGKVQANHGQKAGQKTARKNPRRRAEEGQG